MENNDLIPVKDIQDNSGHWYTMPDKLIDDFIEDFDNDEMLDSGDFDKKYDKYRIGGHLNNIYE